MQSKAQQTLPKGVEQRANIKRRIQTQIERLKYQIKENSQDKKLIRENQNNIQLLNLRNKLIDRCGQLSLLRLSHLEEVFKHYCTHVFKTGKHMTFDRLEYEKVHMTMDRFFLFLKDFQLTSAHIDQKQKEVLQKPLIITLFKKVASNARELSFQEFIQCIEKLAVAYWDQKLIFSKKQEQNRLRMQRIKKLNEKRRKRKMGLKVEGEQQKNKSEEREQQQQKNEEQQQGNETTKKPKQKGQPQQIQNHQNDDLIEELMNNKQIEDPNQQVREVAARAKKQNAQVVSVLQKQHEQFQSLLKLSNEQKIQYYYQLINIDSVDSYKNKLTSLNLQNYINHQQPKQAGKALSESKLQAALQNEQQRLNKLKAKMNEKKQKFKQRPLPKPSNEQAMKQEENSRRRRQMKKQREHAVKQMKVQQVKKSELKAKNVTPKVEYKQGQVSWQMLQKLTLDHLKLKQFNLAKMYAPEEDDRYFMEEYGAKPRIASRLQARERQSLSIVESTKMRAEQLQKRQKEKGSESTRKQTKRNNTTLSKNKI